MNKKLHYYFTLFAIAAVPFIAGAAEKDSVVVDGEVKFYSLQKGSGNSNVSRAGGQTTKAEVTIVGIENKNKEANKRWIRNVEVELSLVYKDEKSKGKGQYVIFRSTAKLFAIQLRQKTPVNFYIPWEAYDIYGIKGDPFAYRIKLKVDGAEIQVSKDNYRSLLSKEIANTPDPAKVMESFEKLVAESSGYNDGVLVSLDKAPFSIQYYEYYSSGGSAIIPTYISEK